MPSTNQTRSHTDELNLIVFKIPTKILLQLSTPPMLLALLGGRAISETLQALGEASEEVFRGDRLAILDFPIKAESKSD